MCEVRQYYTLRFLSIHLLQLSLMLHRTVDRFSLLFQCRKPKESGGTLHLLVTLELGKYVEMITWGCLLCVQTILIQLQIAIRVR